MKKAQPDIIRSEYQKGRKWVTIRIPEDLYSECAKRAAKKNVTASKEIADLLEKVFKLQ